MKQVQVVVPFDKTEEIYNTLVESPQIRNPIRVTTDNAVIIQFRILEG